MHHSDDDMRRHDLAVDAALIDALPSRPRRRRRTRDDVLALIRDAARELFAQRGYQATTTREIARVADVSETLVFRYFGDKASLFDEVVTAPFSRLMSEFVERHPDPTDGNRHTLARQFTRQVYELFEANEPVFRALLSRPSSNEEGGVPSLRGLDYFFAQSVSQVERRYAAAGRTPPFDLRVGVRLGLGMIAASVLMRESLFPDTPPSRGALIHALEEMVEQTLGGPALD